MRQNPRLLILGRQGAGKGTQGAMLARRLGIPHVATGDVLRAEVAAGTRLGREVASYLQSGALVPDSLIIDLVAQRLGSSEGLRCGFLLDGFPRTLAQCRALFDVLGPDAIDLALEIHVPASVVRPRLAARRVCRGCGMVTTAPAGDRSTLPCPDCGGELVRRDDDNERAIERRLALYDEQAAPLLVWLHSRGLLATIDGVGEPDVVHERIVAAVEDAATEVATPSSAPGGLLGRP